MAHNHMRLYLAGPIRGIDDNNAPAFAKAAARLRAMNHEVWNPVEHDEGLVLDDSDASLRGVFRRDLDALLQQDAVVLLPGWERSHGACLERHAADVAGMPVFLYRPYGLVPLSRHDWRFRG